MANFHPSDNELVEFSAGNTDWALSICISAHIELCTGCAHKLRSFNKIGGTALDTCHKVDVSTDSFTKLLNKIESTKYSSGPTKTSHTSNEMEVINSSDKHLDDLPKIIQKLIPADKRLPWKRVAPALQEARLKTGQDKYEVCFHKIKRGGKVAEHNHGGMEVTLVLRGSFSDEQGTYQPGDYIVREAGQVHRPLAAQNQDCLCLSVVEAPIKLTGLIGKLINPFLGFHPA